MTHSKSNKKRKLEEQSKVKHNNNYSFPTYVGFDHITGKSICLNCNSTITNNNCCSNPKNYYLGKILRTPKGNKRSKWKTFYSYLCKYHSDFSILHPEVIEKYNISPKVWIPAFLKAKDLKPEHI